MADLILGLAIMAFASLLVLQVTVRLTKPMSRRTVTLTGVLVGLLMVLYLRYLWKTALLSSVLPFSSIVILSNWFPLAAAFLAGITWTHGYGPQRRRAVFGAAVFAIAAWSTIEPLIGAPPACLDEWESKRGYEVCRQTSRFTCTAAAAATLLQLHGIPAQESEMARLCLTREHTRLQGTTWQGLYRGLKLKSQTHGLDVEVVECPFSELSALVSGPAIISVGIDPGQPYSEIYTQKKWGWGPGIRHSVVLLRPVPNIPMVEIADPSVGIEYWTYQDLRTLFRGRAIQLVPASDG